MFINPPGLHPGYACWFNPSTDKYTTIPNHPGDMPEGTLRTILKQAGISAEDFLKAK